jgi:hypothetical protein
MLVPRTGGPPATCRCGARSSYTQRELEAEEVAAVLQVVTSGPKAKTTTNMLDRILRENGVTFQRTKTWKESNDPKFASKKKRSSASTRRRRRTRA